MHVAQLTPHGSGCSIVVGDLPSQNKMPPGSLHGVQLVVADAEAARAELVGRGVECSEIQVFDERDGGTFFGFSDPDGNTWAVQQIRARADNPLIPVEARRQFGEGVDCRPRETQTPKDPAYDAAPGPSMGARPGAGGFEQGSFSYLGLSSGAGCSR